ncbi:signal peptidase I [Sphingobium subterraneum]|nr:signal peptidase I [Sphingobium subterraneum]
MAADSVMENEQFPQGQASAPDEHATASVSPAAAHHHVDWVGEIRSIALLLLAVLAFHSFVAKPFYIPSESMMPVLLKGDRLVVSKYPYGWSYVSPSFHPLPFLKGRLFGTLPERGDIVIVTPRNTTEDYIKRVIGLPGDVIEVRAGQVMINNIPVPQYTLPPLRIPVDADAPCPAFQFPGALVHGQDGKDVCELPVRREVLPNGKTYQIIDVGPSALDWYGPVRVPSGHLFLMGDNRDNSADSRAPLAERGLGGPVPFESIGGRAEFITFSLNGNTTWNPMTWIGSLRSGRAGTTLRTPREQGR